MQWAHGILESKLEDNWVMKANKIKADAVVKFEVGKIRSGTVSNWVSEAMEYLVVTIPMVTWEASAESEGVT